MTTTQATPLSPGQRTAATARWIMLFGIIGWAPAIAAGSLAASLLMAFIVLAGTALLMVARRAD